MTYTLASIDDFVGTELGVSEWMTIDQSRVDAFADATEDHQWIHASGPDADAGPFGAPIAHGLLSLGLTVMLAESVGALPADSSMCLNYGYDRVRFPAPVPVGSRIRLRVSLAGYEQRTAIEYQITTSYVVEVEGSDKPAMVCDCLGMFYKDAEAG